MARAHSEGAYSSSFDYERYWHALPLHSCIRHPVVLLKLSPVRRWFIRGRPCDERQWYPVRYRLCRSHHCSEVVAVKPRDATASAWRGSELCVSLPASTLLCFFLLHRCPCFYTHPCALKQWWYVEHWCCVLVISVVLNLTCPQLLICTKTDLMYCCEHPGAWNST